MKKLLGIVIMSLVLSGCERVPADVKEWCGSHSSVINAKTDQAAKYAYEGCVAEEMELLKK